MNNEKEMKIEAVDKFSKDIFADAEEYYVSCAELVARHLAKRLSPFNSVADICCMVGATTIQLAKKIPVVYGIDIDGERIKKAKANARLYGVEDRIDFIQGNVFDNEVLKKISADVAVLDPSWRKPNEDRYVFVNSIKDTDPDLKEMFDITSKYLTKNIVLRIPKNFSFETMKEFGPCRMENMIWDGVLRYKFAYFLPEIKMNSEENVYFPKFIYKNEGEFYSPWNGQKHPDAKC
jgi:predicted RNA methylase